MGTKSCSALEWHTSLGLRSELVGLHHWVHRDMSIPKYHAVAISVNYRTSASSCLLVYFQSMCSKYGLIYKPHVEDQLSCSTATIYYGYTCCRSITSAFWVHWLSFYENFLLTWYICQVRRIVVPNIFQGNAFTDLPQVIDVRCQCGSINSRL